ncbi:two-component system sensor histidine kinase PhoQ [Proteus hauseri]|uniref:two-component system sensor histidine kinase PhoQ n=1 Tax=Proteus hauseri TaxID=183417 RepID=UPI0032DB18CD
MQKKQRSPFSLRTRFLLATSAIILALTLSYGLVAIVGSIVSIDKTTYMLMRSQSNLYYSLAQWQNGKLNIEFPTNLNNNNTSLVVIFDSKGDVLWTPPDLPKSIPNSINPKWRSEEGLFEITADIKTTRSMLQQLPQYRAYLKRLDEYSRNDSLTHSVVINHYPAEGNIPYLAIAVIDPIPQRMQKVNQVWDWFLYVLLANFLLVIPLIWLAAHWSLRPIKSVIEQISALEKGSRSDLDENPPTELKGVVRNLNVLLRNERNRYSKYRTSLSDLTHSLKTPLAVLQSTLRSLRSGKQMSIEQAEPIMLAQIERISQQVGYYLHRASIHGDHDITTRKLHSLSGLLDNLCSALSKVYQTKGVDLSLNVSPEIMWLGEKNDFMEVMGNILDNACKYCLEFVEINVNYDECSVIIIVDDDGPGVSPEKRTAIFQRGTRADTLRPGQGLGLSIAVDIIEQYSGEIVITDSPLGGARITVIFKEQQLTSERE